MTVLRFVVALTCVAAIARAETPVPPAPATEIPSKELSAQESPATEPLPEEQLPLEYSPPPETAYAPPPGLASPLHIHGYLDVGSAMATGNGTSFHPNEHRLPIDYAADPFATAVNSRGDVASIDSGGRFTNGFLPRSMGIGSRPSAFVNTASLDVRFEPEASPLVAFTRLQFLPRLNDDQSNRDTVLLQQAFVRVQPIASEEFTVTVGKFDSVFGIEYLDNEAPIRTGITPSLSARYTTGWQVGAKAFYRLQLPALYSAFSLNAAVTNNAPFVDALMPSNMSLTGRPTLSGRLGYELALPFGQLKLGSSVTSGARNDQTDPTVGLWGCSGDLRLVVGWFSLAGELTYVKEGEGAGDKAGPGTLVSPFEVTALWGTASLALPVHVGVFEKFTPYLTYARRRGGFTGFAFLDNDRLTVGARADLGDNVALKLEWLRNDEYASTAGDDSTPGSGAARVDNNVVTSSLVVWF